MSDRFILVEVDGVSGDFGSIVTFTGYTEDGRPVTVSAEHRPAQDIIRALEDGTEGPVIVAVEPWQLGHWY